MEAFFLFAAAAGSVATLPAPNEPPQASFVVRDGWLHIRVTDAGRPVSDVTVRCLVGTHQWAEGETGSDGGGAFPAPKAGTCQMVFDLGTGLSAPIPLTFLTDGSAVPTSAAVRDVYRDCCREISLLPIGKSSTQVSEAKPAVWPLAILGLTLGTVLTVGLVWCLRRWFLIRQPDSNRRANHARP